MSTGPSAVDRRRGLRALRRALQGLGVLVLLAIVAALLVDRIFFPSASSPAPAGTGSGVAATQHRSVAPFTGIDLAGNDNVIVEIGPRRSVVVHADDNLLGRVTTRVRSGNLVIGTTPGDLSATTAMYVAVRVPSLDRLTLHGAGNIAVTGIRSRNLTVALPGTGNVAATGSARKLHVTLSGQGTAALRQLIARDASAALTGGGSITLTATHRLVASLSGSGTVTYAGNPPHVAKRLTGSGAISAG